MTKQKVKPGTWIIKENLGEYFDFFKDIPEKKWCKDVFVDEEGRMCALGLVGERPCSWGRHPLRKKLSIDDADVSEINNGCDGYTDDLGDTPKERILNAIILKESGILENV